MTGMVKVDIYRDERWPDWDFTVRDDGKFELSEEELASIRAAGAEYARWQSLLEKRCGGKR